MYAAKCRPEVVLVDADTPGIDCVELLAELRRASPDSECLAVAARPSVAFVVEAFQAGASDVLRASAVRHRTAISHAIAAAETRRIVRALETAPPAEPDLVGCSSSTAAVRTMLDRLSRTAASKVLIEGETGTGKEVVASLVHCRGPRSAGPLLRINCAALPSWIVESELFGHARGAFTSAREESRGLVEAANGGTLFLDEIADLPLETQAKLLRLLDQGTYRRVGDLEERQADVVVVAATNLDLERRVREGRFRNDLFFRLDLVRIRLAPLRDRREDIPELAATFVAEFARALCRSVRGVSSAALAILQEYPWPGNVRELRNVVERAFVVHPKMEELRPEHLPPTLCEASRARPPLAAAMPSLAAAERNAIALAMEEARGNVAAAARRLGLGRHALRDRLRRHGLAG
jgi:DNA-binding NtrC family response regulator